MMKRRVITGMMLGAIITNGATLRVNPEPVREMDRFRLLGSNVGVFYKPREVFDADVQFYLRDLNPTYLRIPGGSWSDRYVWNGNGVYDGNKIDMSKRVKGLWQVDYSDYQPGFCLEDSQGNPYHWHGDLDVAVLHDFVKDKGAEEIVTVNVGTGTPEMAAEWVRWANVKMGFGVKYWEIGNELEGFWEVGHIQADGTQMTGELYAQKFVEFAKAMKAVDPTLKIGGPVTANLRAEFLEATLRDAGDWLDFISIHTYPVEGHLEKPEEIIRQAFVLEKPIQRYRSLIERYQSARSDEIEIAITEWNSKVQEDRTTGDLLSGLWNAAFIGEMFRHQVDFATHWDLLTETEEGGHGLFQFVGRCMPKAQYWGLYLWSKHMGNQLLETELLGAENVYAFATRDAERFYVMLINVNRDERVEVDLELPQLKLSDVGRRVTLSHREYFWDPYTHQPKWSRKPSEQDFAMGGRLEVPPYSARVFELPLEGARFRSELTEGFGDEPFEIMLPEQASVDAPIEGWVLLRDDPQDPRGVLQGDGAELLVSGPAHIDVQNVSLKEAAGRFFLTPTGAGTVTVEARAGNRVVKQAVEIEKFQERTEMVWQFEDRISDWGVRSDYTVTAEDTVKPNQRVAAVEIDGFKKEMAVFTIPEGVQKKRIAGVVVELGRSADFQCQDQEVAVRVVLQSLSNHWIDLGSVIIDEEVDGWKHVEFALPDATFRQVMSGAYAVYFELYSTGGKSAPVTGKIYLDNLGFILK